MNNNPVCACTLARERAREEVTSFRRAFEIADELADVFRPGRSYVVTPVKQGKRADSC